MKFNIDGIVWKVRFALVRDTSPKNEIIVDDIESIYRYLSVVNNLSIDEVKEIVKEAEDA